MQTTKMLVSKKKQVIRDVLEEYSNVFDNGYKVYTMLNQLLLEMVKLTIRRRTVPYCADYSRRKTVREKNK